MVEDECDVGYVALMSRKHTVRLDLSCLPAFDLDHDDLVVDPDYVGEFGIVVVAISKWGVEETVSGRVDVCF